MTLTTGWTKGMSTPSVRWCSLGVDGGRSLFATCSRSVIQSRPGSGFYVAPHVAPLAWLEVGPKLDRVVDPFWVSRQSLEAMTVGSSLAADGCRRRSLSVSSGQMSLFCLSRHNPTDCLPPLLGRSLANGGVCQASLMTGMGREADDNAFGEQLKKGRGAYRLAKSSHSGTGVAQP